MSGFEHNEIISNLQVGKYLYIWIDILGFGDFVKKGNSETLVIMKKFYKNIFGYLNIIKQNLIKKVNCVMSI